MYPILLDFGQITLFGFDIHLRIPSYGFFYALAIIVGWLMFRKFGRERHPNAPWTDIFFLSVIVGIAGARLLNGLTVLPDVLAGRVPFYAIFLGGGVWLGGALSGTAMYMYFLHRYKIDKGFGANTLFAAMPLAHAVGRIGCFLGGCCYGARCEMPWAVSFSDPLAHKVNATPLNVPLHPTQLYEVGVELINFVICYKLFRANARGWSVMLVWFGLYGGERFILEFFRADYRGGLAWLSTSQWLSLGMLVLAGTILATWIRRGTLFRRSTTTPSGSKGRAKAK